MSRMKPIIVACQIVPFFILVILGTAKGNSRENLFEIQRIGLENGLPARMVYHLEQDKIGFVWVASQFGIHRYDGSRFKTYTNGMLGLPERTPPFLAADVDGRLWFSAHTQVGKEFWGVLDILGDSLIPKTSLFKGQFSPDGIRSVCPLRGDGPERTIVLTTTSGEIWLYDGEYRKQIAWKDNPKPLPQFVRQTNGDIVFLDRDNIYFLHQDHSVDTVKVPLNGIERVHRLLLHQGNPVVKITEKAHSKYVKFTDRNPSPFTYYNHLNDSVDEICAISDQYLLVPRIDSMVVIDRWGKELQRFPMPGYRQGHSAMFVFDRITDGQGNLWFTTANGLFKLSVRPNLFEIKYPGESIYGILKKGSELWRAGIYSTAMEDLETGSVLTTPEHFGIWAFGEGDNGSVWAGGLINAIHFLPDEEVPAVYSCGKKIAIKVPFFNNVSGHVLCGTGNGIVRFEKLIGGQDYRCLGSVSLDGSPDLGQVFSFYQNTQGIWAASANGLYLLDAKSEQIIAHYNKADGLPEEAIHHLHEDKDGVFWMAARWGGLVRWNPKTSDVRRFTTEDGLPHNNIYAVYEDDFKTLWLPTDYGLVAFDKETYSSRVFLPRNGIAHEEFNTYSHFQDVDGSLYFGGLGGITSFHPRDLHKRWTEHESPLLLASVRVLSEDRPTFEDRTKTVSRNAGIVLAPEDRILELELSLLDFENESFNQFAYRIEGVQDQWVYTRDPRLSLFNLPYGNHRLIIKARGASGGWNEQMLSLPIRVLRPFYMQTWFILVLIFGVLILSAISIWWRLNSLKKDRERLEREVDLRTRKIATQAEELKELDKIKSQFFSNITHEFRTPLTLILGPANQMVNANPPSEIKKGLNGIVRNASMLLQLINQLLDLSKLENQNMQIEMSHGDIVGYCGELMNGFKLLAGQNNIDLQFKPFAERWETHFDRGKMDKIVNNLLSNAMKFTPEGGEVELSLQQADARGQDCILLLVRDNGSGIEPEHADKVFNRFYQANSSHTRLQGGTGIGLALVRELVEMQGGSITVKSSPGMGATFVVLLPVGDSPSKQQPQLDAPGNVEIEVQEVVTLGIPETVATPVTKSHVGRLLVLVIDDNADMRDYIRSCIDQNKYDIVEAKDGEEGIEKALQLVPDLVISDVMMPVKDGFEVVESIREHLATSHIPLILLTAKSSLDSRLEGLRRGADAYLTKPFSPDELSLRIEKLIEIRQAMKARYLTDSAESSSRPNPELDLVFDREDSFMYDLKRYIEENMTRPDLKVDTISSHLGISRTQLYRKLQSLSVDGIGDLIRKARCAKAKDLIAQKELTFTEIAYEVGFSSPSHFSRTFRKIYGYPPSQQLELQDDPIS